MKTTVLSLAIFAVGIPAAANAAATAEQPPKAVVAYRDLNLASLEGEKILQSRVRKAVETVCARPLTHWSDKVKQRSCEKKAMEGAKPQVETALRNAGRAYAMSNAATGIVIR